MKEIPKYRVWNARGVRGGKVKDGPLKEMIYFNLFDLDREYIIGERAYLEGNYKLMQFTGLSDKIGKEIYEGDVVKTDYDDVYEVLSPTFFPFVDGDYAATGANSEVIGNVYENPELLK